MAKNKSDWENALKQIEKMRDGFLEEIKELNKIIPSYKRKHFSKEEWEKGLKNLESLKNNTEEKAEELEIVINSYKQKLLSFD